MADVLLVDDEPLLCEELADSLELEGFDVAMEHSVPDALKVMEGKGFDVVVTDLKMPKVSGLDFLRALGERDYKGLIIVISGHGAETSRSDALELGAKACLAKPVDVDDVIEIIETHLS
ncbi:Transcriptional regulatory protein FixJ [Pelagimonas phthalicica]|uniref:Transcriptional regulatory protein FixJ n=1 Tax=Pelagimonas phthalicica TaxID=1037362 RepID=A0A238J6H0_9RHOB|nr:response regulator [Pelagimonas phthalicica]TDS95228.1 response regulator receiver domain-containing protein [Pelagimonas phthalicica]SMX26248.1 Transcriptional regulatory protein FixJ [Pelagimonas phthalicica]